MAVNQNNKPVVDLLLKHGANTLITNKDGRTALHFSVQLKKTTISRQLIEHGANLNQQDNDGCTALFYAVSRGHLGQIKLLVSSGADINLRTVMGQNALHRVMYAKYKNRSIIMRYLLENGGYLNDPDLTGNTALHYAVKLGSLNVFKMCLEFNGNPTVRNMMNGLTVTHFAAMNIGHKSLLEFILRQKKLPGDEPNMQGCTPLHEAVKIGNYDACNILLDQGANVNAKYNSHTTPLLDAAHLKWLDIVELLLLRGATIDIYIIEQIAVSKFDPEINEAIIRYMAISNCLGRWITENDGEFIKHYNIELGDYYDECVAELCEMRECRFYRNGVSLFDILTKTDIRRFVRNPSFRSAFEVKNCKRMFANYATIVENRFLREISVHNTLLKAENVLFKILSPRLRGEQFIIENILSFLPYKEAVSLAQY